MNDIKSQLGGLLSAKGSKTAAPEPTPEPEVISNRELDRIVGQPLEPATPKSRELPGTPLIPVPVVEQPHQVPMDPVLEKMIAAKQEHRQSMMDAAREIVVHANALLEQDPDDYVARSFKDKAKQIVDDVKILYFTKITEPSLPERRQVNPQSAITSYDAPSARATWGRR